MNSAGTPTVTRRLAAILIADVVGYTRLMERDDTGTFARLRSIRDEVVDPAIVSHDGRIVKTAGDGFLAEFPSALAALRASVQIQREMAKRNADVLADDRLDYRIGVNLGDIMIDGTDIAGDGVNVASRLESLAEPGDICVSGSVREQVHGQLDVSFADIGEQQVKNIERPIRVYRLALASTHRRAASRPAPVGGRRLLAWPAAAVLIVMISVGSWMLTTSRQAETTAPPPFSLAVFPFTASAGDDELADRLTRDLTTTLGQWRLAHVASRGQVAPYAGKPIDARNVGRDLRVRYLIEGEIGRIGERLLVTVRAIDTTSGTQAWGDRMEFEPALLAAEPNAVLIRTASRLRAGIKRHEERRAVEHPENGSVLNWVLRGNAASRADSWLAGARESLKFDDQALRIDPDYVPALIARSFALHWEIYEDPTANRAALAGEMDSLSRRAVALDNGNPDAWGARADALGWLARWDEAVAASDKALALGPTHLELWDNSAWLMYAMGRPDESLAIAKRIIAIDPPGEGIDWYFMCRGNLMLGRYAEAVSGCEKAAALDPLSWQNQLQLVAAYAQNGDLAKAAVTKDELLKRQPGYTIAKDRARLFSNHPAFVKQIETHLYPGLRKAGIPEQ